MNGCKASILKKWSQHQYMITKLINTKLIVVETCTCGSQVVGLWIVILTVNDHSISDNNNHIIIGWFQWYCRFFQGRRCSDDARQISRGNAVMGPKGRWRNNLINKILASSPKDLQKGLDNHSISPVVRQLLQHWGYVLKLKDLEAAANR